MCVCVAAPRCGQISAACGSLGTLVLGSALESLHAKATGGRAAVKLEYANNGVLAGLVAITAGCSVNASAVFVRRHPTLSLSLSLVRARSCFHVRSLQGIILLCSPSSSRAVLLLLFLRRGTPR
jgi:hypothetical protein